MSRKGKHKTLIVGIGNTSRGDDALGWKFLDFIQENRPPGTDLCYRYQLHVEDAEMLTGYSRIYFADATEEEFEEGYDIKACLPSDAHALTSHELLPETVLQLAESLYSHRPEAYVIAISGSRWGLGNGLSRKAFRNLIRLQEYWKKNLLPEMAF